MSYILGASGFSWAGSGFGSAEDEAPRRTREKNSGTQGICPTVRHETLAGGVYFLRFFQQSTKISSHE